VSEKTATDRLRDLLDERGIEHVDDDDGHTRHTWWSDGDHEISACNSGEKLAGYNLIPEQIIAATVGTRTCRNISKVTDTRGRKIRFVCSECGAWIDSEFIWDYEYSSGGSPWVQDCKLNYCPNCGRRIEVSE
jgi:predicted RNA-binding Zn-ribbon protein involved in translation (DUF1610 family)